MKLIKRKNQNRRDFTGVYECEHCKHVQEQSSYDDTHFHANVIPDMVCAACSKKAPVDCIKSAPTHSDSVVI